MTRTFSYLLPPLVDEWLPDDHLVPFCDVSTEGTKVKANVSKKRTCQFEDQLGEEVRELLAQIKKSKLDMIGQRAQARYEAEHGKTTWPSGSLKKSRPAKIISGISQPLSPTGRCVL